eukprot:6150909-Pyramimonas_sp.AAC.1
MRCTTHRTTTEITKIEAPSSKNNGNRSEGQEKDGMGGTLNLRMTSLGTPAVPKRGDSLADRSPPGVA